MKTKKLVILLIVLAVISMLFAGCDAINGAFDSVFLSTPEVKAADLADYTSQGDVNSTADLEKGFGLGMSALGSTGASRSILADDYNAVVNVLKIASPDVARVIGPSEILSRSASAGVNASITNEEFTEGGITVDVDELSFSAEIDMDDIDEPTVANAKFDAKVELALSDIVDEYYDSGTSSYVPYTVKEFRLNVNGNGNGKASFGTGGFETLQQVDYYTGLAVSIGFSLSAPDCSGKYLLSFKYVNSATISVNDPEPNFTGEESIEVTVSVYGNNGDLLEEKTYTESELFTLML